MTVAEPALGQRIEGREDAAVVLARLLSAGAVVRAHEPLAKRTTLRVGGPADLYVVPANELDLSALLHFAAEKQMPFFVIGRGSNLLVKDGGFRGIAISLANTHFSRIEPRERGLVCGAGARLKQVAIMARRQGLSGMEFLEGIPGSIGGALRMNAGAMSGAMFDIVETVSLMDFRGNICEKAPRDLVVEYRACKSLKTHIALAAVLRGTSASPESIEAQMNEFSRKRWQSQPAAPSAGCMFKNPPSIPAGKLIEELGLKGTRVGAAVVSQEHGNFIINEGKATARDVLELIALIQRRAREERAIDLQTEVEIIGE
jgi:UDP-N-acetylenolpyruvoylglucosamine reductase